MTLNAFPCPFCGSADVRRSHRHSFAERLGMVIGTYPFRCLACNERFLANVWRLSNQGFAKCPRCLRLDIVPLTKDEGRMSALDRAKLAFGAHIYRCVPCRLSFVSFQRNISSEDISPEEV